MSEALFKPVGSLPFLNVEGEGVDRGSVGGKWWGGGEGELWWVYKINEKIYLNKKRCTS